MTQQEILDYNKRCAKFLGAELYIPKPWYYLPKYQEHYYFKNRYEPNRFTLKMMKFHSDWNWIMEVVEAIQKIRPLIISHNHCEIHMYEEWKNISINIATNSTITAVIQAINQFLIWYNEQSKTLKT